MKPSRTTAGRVLLVDDDPILIRVYSSVFRAAGLSVATAGGGEEALSLLAGDRFDSVVTDISMPGLDGMALLRAIRERGLEVPVVIVTGRPELSTAVQAVELGAFRYLVKPVQHAELRQVVERAVRLHRLARVKREAQAYVGEVRPGHDTAALAERFDRALDGLDLAFQPIVRWPERRLYAYEALLRTSEPSFARPEELVGAAEWLGRIHELGQAIRARAAQRMRGSSARLFVNLHSEELLDETLYDPRSPLSTIASRTVLEITERAGLERIPDARSRAERLKRMGFRIAVDDLGAGYSGLNSFVQLDPQVVKLDITLVRNLHREPRKEKLVRSIAALCKGLDITVLAEGIESCEERDALEELGCGLLQGFLFARPAAAFPSVHW